ncbi:unnamed protein product [Meloidogyne enterolobii]|uniref:Uncharacterized protein n=1 Tax=Meloidogyne enterolobii TaxID=390850 RepID=A0ACB0ZX60_MELEN
MLESIGKRMKKGEFSKGEKSSAGVLKKEFKEIREESFRAFMFLPFKEEFTNWLKHMHYENLNEIIFSKTDYGEELRMRALEG